ncbi:Tyrosine kinase domain-containing protein [Rhizoctonia solani]|uniref:Tyrosine kinase domain-containing protein n=1 Tax=Rhizoctonia solani TaxID=456999 RepID=A0A8H8SY06_9AGAM|nr:Tyrosine kinase domain-containing protein [Rhizoctonia solani]QRW22691.1 Tyrosine kinase domain-containing protein [Rhizoctonia solani]
MSHVTESVLPLRRDAAAHIVGHPDRGSGVSDCDSDEEGHHPSPYRSQVSARIPLGKQVSWSTCTRLCSQIHYRERASQPSTDSPPSETTEDPFSANYHHVQYEPGAYAPYYAPLLSQYTLEPLDFHNYHPNAPRHSVSRSHFMTPDLRDELHRKQDAFYQTPFGHPTPPLPDEVHAYHSLAILEPAPSQSFLGGFSTSVYRAVNSRDGNTYVLYRVENCRLPHDSALTTMKPGQICLTRVSARRGLRIPSTARTLQAQHLAPSTPPGANSRSQQSSPTKPRTFSPNRNFPPAHFGPTSPTSQYAGSPPFNSPAFAPGSTFGSPNAQSYGFPRAFQVTHSRHHRAEQTLSQPPPRLPKPSRNPHRSTRLQARSLRNPNFLLKCTHERALRDRPWMNDVVDVFGCQRVLVTGVGRVRINTVGLVDIMTYDGQPTPEVYLQEDLLSLGSLLLQLVCGTSNLSQLSIQSPTNQSPSTRRTNNNANSVNQQNLASAQALSRFSPLLRQTVVWLVTPAVGKTIEHLFKEISPAIIGAEMDAMLDQADTLESELSRELENGRLVRLLCKFGFINERPEFDHDPRWAETGDRYIIKLFRDHVFHQVDARGKPVLNLTHVLVNLSKLDAGSEERLMLVSRDERNCLVVSYKEIKTCIENAYRDLAK